MSDIESAWPRYPGYRIDVVPVAGRVRVTHDDVLLADSERALRVEESNHVDRIYLPADDVRWDLFTPSETRTVCPFKGEATYWSLTGAASPLTDVAWSYPAPLAEVDGIAGHVCFYEDRVRVELDDTWPGRPDGTGQRLRLPVWGDQADLARIMDAQAVGDGRYRAPVVRELHPDMDDYRGTFRNVVEGGQLLGTAICAASKEIPEQRVTMATLNFIKAATFDEPIDVDVEVLRRGRTFSTTEVRLGQAGGLCSAGILLHGSDADDVMRHDAALPDVGGPDEAVPIDFWVSGREVRVVDAGYDDSTTRLGPPEIHSWIRFRDRPEQPYVHAALAAQAVTHWTIAASMRPHEGIGEQSAHLTLATGPMTATVWFCDDIDVTEWMLYSNPSPWAGRGLAQGEGRIHAADGRLLGTYGVQAMVRAMQVPPDAIGGANRAM